MVLGFLPPSCAISAQPGCSLPWSPAGPAQSPRAGGVWGRRVKLPSLSVCPGPPCCLDGAALPCPHVFGVRLSVFLLFFYIEAPGPVPTPSPALRLIYLSLRTRLLCFQPLLLPYS